MDSLIKSVSAAVGAAVGGEVRILVKGSRVNKLERLVKALTAPALRKVV